MADPRGESRIRLKHAVRRHRALSREGLLERLFERLFRGLVYTQIWEDPEIDLEALALDGNCHVVAIASGGCNVLSYLTADPAHITAVDLSLAHVALNRLKLTAACRLPTWQAFYRFFGAADDAANIEAYDRLIAPHLDAESRAYWQRRNLHQGGRRRISIFARNAYRHGVLGRFIGVSHVAARLYGVDLRQLLTAQSIEEQRRFFETTLAPLFDKPAVRWATANRLSLYGLGIPPAQYEALAGGSDMRHVLRSRVERLACGFSLDDNYFAWQAFGRSYAGEASGPLPPYLRREHFHAVRSRADRVEVMNRSITEYLAGCPDASRDRYVLLDAQDWMTDAQLDALWRQITRTARPGARVIFRTAAEPSLLPGRLDPDLLRRWRYEETLSRELTDRDRSAIYGGFHLYVLEG
ncbi:S-adenosylmethionine-diacylglycerol 3-amino-3-carboxypropyl transferase [Rhodospirillales bacterium URHD0017]|nr:S-adenosylmethionine-diacylglycerol 3-amino-3-carboxypropyl transferase [Rhodospirillales bacterium URHD0017]